MKELTITDVLPLLHKVSELSTGEYLACCPAHDDQEPSLTIREKNGKLLWHCHAGCSQDAVWKAILREYQKYHSNGQERKSEGLTVEEYAQAKLLDANRLKQWHVHTVLLQGKKAVKIEYRDITGDLISVQYRTALEGDRFRLRKGDSHCLYGLWRLSDKVSVIMVVEGVSDCHTLWMAGIPAIGIPSASSIGLAPKLWEVFKKHLPQNTKIVLCVDNDEAGQKLRQELTRTCPDDMRQRVYTIDLPAKDVSDLWIQLKGDRDKFIAVLKNAQKTPISVDDELLNTDNDNQEPAAMDTHLETLSTLWQHHRRYCVDWGKWLFWNGTRWEKIPDMDKVLHDAREDLKRYYITRMQEMDVNNQEFERYLYALYNLSKSTKALRDAIILLQGRDGYRARSHEMDADPYLINTPAGVINLHTLEILSHKPEYNMTRITNASPKQIDTPLWNQFLQRIFANDTELIRFVQKVFGLCLLGQNLEQKMYILWGAGANGKSTLVNTIMYVLGDYARAIPRDAIVSSRRAQDALRISFSALEGVRMGVLEEFEEGAILNTIALKTLTSNNPIDVRAPYERNRQITLHLIPLVCTNMRPKLTEMTEAVWRRLILIPFTVIIPPEERDPNMVNKLKAEADGILNWMLDGLRLYYQEGLNPPAEVEEAIQDYRSSEDILDEFIRNFCEESPRYKISSKELYQHYCDWVGSDDEKISSREFTRLMKAKGYNRRKIVGNWYWIGLRVKDLKIKIPNDGGTP